MLVTANIFQPLIDVFEAVLKFFHNSVGVPWGWSIVLLTVVIRALLVPLTLKQFHSMQRLQQLQPELKAIQAKYKDDKQRQQQEMMKFYKENKVNPLGSCLPLVAQLPVFISLFYMLRSSLRADICPQLQPARTSCTALASISTAHTVACGPPRRRGLPVHQRPDEQGDRRVLIVLIVLYVGHPARLEPDDVEPDDGQDAAADHAADAAVLRDLHHQLPAGVIVYWITTNTWTIAQQYVVKQTARADGAAGRRGGRAAADGGGGGSGGGGGRGPATATATAERRRLGGGLGGLLRGAAEAAEEPTAVGDASRGRASGTAPAAAAQEEEALRAAEVAMDGERDAERASRRSCWSGSPPRPASRPTVEVREDDDGIVGRVRRRRPRPADRPPRPDDRRDPAPRLPDRLPRRGRRASAWSSMPPATASAARSRCARPPTRRPRPRCSDGRPVSLEAMSALERKVVHEHLKSRHDVETYSEGQEPARRLVVAPLVELRRRSRVASRRAVSRFS